MKPCPRTASSPSHFSAATRCRRSSSDAIPAPSAAPGPIRLALVIEDLALADRLAALLAGVPGLRLVGATEAADAAVVTSTVISPSADGDVPLTPRELEVLALLAEGASNKVIARRLGISVHTAKFHVASLLDKLDAVGRTDAVAHAARRGVINL